VTEKGEAMQALTEMQCRPMSGASMSDADVSAHLALVPGWALVDGAIEKSFGFPDFHRTMAFVNALAWIAHREDHHPDMAVGYSRCTVRFSTHSVHGISLNDFICAAKADRLLA
jgi:4a-hydroxytetrahydrobiopterin dehydratase